MGSANKHHHVNSSKTTKNLTQYPTTSSDTEDVPNPNPNPNPSLEPIQMETESVAPFTIDGSEEDSILSKSEFLTREEVIKRRYRRLKLEIQVYEDYYWALMEDYRVKHREYYWNYGKSPFKEEEEVEVEVEVEKKEKNKDENGDFVEGTDEINNNVGNGKSGIGTSENGGGSGSGKNKKCALSGCKLKPMALSNHCYTHILFDSKQTLYKPCTYMLKSQLLCGKPVQRGTVPLVCIAHYEKTQLHVAQALRRAGCPVTSSASRASPKFHVIVAEAIREINLRRRIKKNSASKNVNNNNAGVKVLDKEENNSKTDMEELD